MWFYKEIKSILPNNSSFFKLKFSLVYVLGVELASYIKYSKNVEYNHCSLYKHESFTQGGYKILYPPWLHHKYFFPTTDVSKYIWFVYAFMYAWIAIMDIKRWLKQGTDPFVTTLNEVALLLNLVFYLICFGNDSYNIIYLCTLSPLDPPPSSVPRTQLLTTSWSHRQ